MKNWYAVYTKPGSEMKVAGMLTQKKIECFCPVRKTDQKPFVKKITGEEPLITSFIFVKVNRDEHDMLKKTEHVMNMVYWMGEPVVVEETDICMMRDFLDRHPQSRVTKMPVSASEPARIVMSTSADRLEKQVLFPALGFIISSQEKGRPSSIGSNHSAKNMSRYRHAN